MDYRRHLRQELYSVWEQEKGSFLQDFRSSRQGYAFGWCDSKVIYPSGYWTLGLISGGILGNLYDRLGFWWSDYLPLEWKSGVRDWILFRLEGVPLFDPWPNFNIADTLLVIGAGMLFYQSLVLENRDKK